MSDVNDLIARLEGTLTTLKEKAKAQQQQELRHQQERQKMLKEYEKLQARIVEVCKPRLEALARHAGQRVSVTPSVTGSRRSARFEFKSPKAFITLVFSAAPDRDLKNAVVSYDLQIVPVLWRFDTHGEFSTPVAAPDLPALTKWLDDRIVGFVELYLQIHEGELYDKAEYVEDPVAKVQFPKFAAGATLEHDGRTYFFIDDESKAAFAKQKGLASK